MTSDDPAHRLPTDGPQRGDGLRILIAEPNSFFAQDMLAGLKEAAPGVRAATFPAIASLRQHLGRIVESDAAEGAGLGHDRLVIIVSDTLAEVRAAGLDQEIDRLRGRLVMVQGYDSATELTAAGVLVLATPFTPAGLSRLVDTLLR